MGQTLFKGKSPAILLSLIFAVCWVIALLIHANLEDSALNGYVRDGKYVLSLGHGTFQETSRERFDAVRRRERIVYGCVAGAVTSWIAAALLVWRARSSD